MEGEIVAAAVAEGSEEAMGLEPITGTSTGGTVGDGVLIRGLEGLFREEQESRGIWGERPDRDPGRTGVVGGEEAAEVDSGEVGRGEADHGEEGRGEEVGEEKGGLGEEEEEIVKTDLVIFAP